MRDKQLRIFFIVATLTAVYLMRIAGALQDGLSERAIIDGVMVGWWPWHIFGWMARDCVQFGLLVFAGIMVGIADDRDRLQPFKFVGDLIPRMAKIRIRLQPFLWIGWFCMHGLANHYLHDLIYWWAVAHRNLFLW